MSNIRPNNPVIKPYGTVKAIKDAVACGAGIFYRDDVEVLLKQIEKLETSRK